MQKKWAADRAEIEKSGEKAYTEADIQDKEVSPLKKLFWLLAAAALLLGLCPGAFAELSRRELALETELEELDSSLFSAVGYDAENRILVLRFRDTGALYAYYELPAGEYGGFMDAGSRGAYFQENIKGIYEYERLDREEADGDESRRSSGADYVLNTNTKKFHRPGCGSVKKMKESNKRAFHGERAEVLAMGYQPCGNCKP